MNRYKLSIFYRNTAFFSIVAFFIIFLSLVMVANHNHFPIPLQLTLYMTGLLPVIFIKKTRSLFMQEVSIQLHSTGLLLDRLNKKQLQYNYTEIKSYQVELPTDEIKCIKLELKNGRRENFSFFYNSKKLGSNPDEFIEEVSHAFNQQGITLKPSFFATKKGLVLIYTFGFLILVEIAAGIIFNSKISALAFMNIALIIRFYAQRTLELKMYEKWHDK